VEDERARAHGLEKAQGRSLTDVDGHGPTKSEVSSVTVGDRPRSSVCFSSMLVANAALSLLNLCCYLLDRQLAAQADAFEKEGGFTERLYRVRTTKKRSSS
jgi:four helix bundle suffix protein